MKYNELILTSKKSSKRVGRGIAAGQGKTAGRGTKGQGARKSGGVRPGFEGGQMPLYMRIPKLRGFKSKKVKPEIAYTGQLDGVKKTIVDTTALADAGIISSPYVNVKLIYKGELKNKKTVKLPSASTNAVAAIEKVGGTFNKVGQVPRTAKREGKASS